MEFLNSELCRVPGVQNSMKADESVRNLGVFRILVRHFFGRFFDTESLSPQGDPAAGVIQTLGILAVPGAFFVFLFRPLSLAGWSLVGVRYIFVTFSMIVMGFVMVFEWDALFPDRRDYLILTPQPVRLFTLFAAKAAALAIFLSIFLADVNFFSVIFWPGVDGGPGFFSILWPHMVAVLAGGLFSALAIASLHGLLVTFLRGSWYRRASVALQTLLMASLVMLLFLTPLLGFRIQPFAEQQSPWLERFPPFWFIGFYEQLRPATHNPALRHAGSMAVPGLWIAAAVFVATLLPGYRGHARRALESPVEGSRRGRLLPFNLLRDPVEQSVFRFLSATIMRSTKHRLFLATYGGFGAAMAVIALRPGSRGNLELPLMLSFILVSGLRAAFNFPSELRANWIFRVSETAGVQPYVAATRKWIFLCAILPLFLLLLPLELLWHSPLAAAFHTIYGVVLSLFLVEILFFGFRKTPFTCAHFPGKVNLTGLGVIYIFGFTWYSDIFAALERWLESYPAAAAIFLILAAGACAAVSAGDRRRRSHEAAVLDFEESADPLITLDITAS